MNTRDQLLLIYEISAVTLGPRMRDRVPCAIELPLAHPVKQEVDAQCDKLHSHALRSTITSRHTLSTCLTDNDAVDHTERSHLFCRAKLTVTASTLASCYDQCIGLSPTHATHLMDCTFFMRMLYKDTY